MTSSDQDGSWTAAEFVVALTTPAMVALTTCFQSQVSNNLLRIQSGSTRTIFLPDSYLKSGYFSPLKFRNCNMCINRCRSIKMYIDDFNDASCILRCPDSSQLATIKANCVDNETRHVVNETICDVTGKPEVDVKPCIDHRCPLTSVPSV